MTDPPEEPMDFSAFEWLEDLSPEERQSIFAIANIGGGSPRAFLGRQSSGASERVLRDGDGKARLVLSVAGDGSTRITFMDETGQARPPEW